MRDKNKVKGVQNKNIIISVSTTQRGMPGMVCMHVLSVSTPMCMWGVHGHTHSLYNVHMYVNQTLVTNGKCMHTYMYMNEHKWA